MNAVDKASDWQKDKNRFGPHGWLVQPAYWAVAVYRFGRWTRTLRGPQKILLHGMYFVSYLFVRSATGIDIPRSVKIGPGLMIHHFGGVIIHPQAELGADCTLRHGVTIGVRKDDDHPPVIGDRVTFGAYAQVLGDVTIGDDVLIGSLTLVLNDIPSNSTVVGIPGKVVSTDSDEASS